MSMSHISSSTSCLKSSTLACFLRREQKMCLIYEQLRCGTGKHVMDDIENSLTQKTKCKKTCFLIYIVSFHIYIFL